ncbi:MAG: NYN domain-containing protein [Succinivibrionaceae bacterium]|nr:NYN domain-containing protein [Succinivibrionaceae bacterium]
MIEQSRTAILINAEDIPHQSVPIIYSAFKTFCDIRIFRIFGNFSKPSLSDWLRVSRLLPVELAMAPDNTHGKSSADLALALDAMDLLYTDDIESYCLCSSGSDFSRLARTLTASGKHVIGIGGRNSCRSFAVSCESFFCIPDLLEDHGALLSSVIRGGSAPEPEEPRAPDADGVHDAAGSPGEALKAECSTRTDSMQRTVHERCGSGSGCHGQHAVSVSYHEVEQLVLRIVRRLSGKKKHRKVNVCDLGNELRKEIPNFSTLDYGYAKFKSFLRSFRFLKFESHKGKKTIVTMDSHYRVQYE